MRCHARHRVRSCATRRCRVGGMEDRLRARAQGRLHEHAVDPGRRAAGGRPAAWHRFVGRRHAVAARARAGVLATHRAPAHPPRSGVVSYLRRRRVADLHHHPRSGEPPVVGMAVQAAHARAPLHRRVRRPELVSASPALAARRGRGLPALRRGTRRRRSAPARRPALAAAGRAAGARPGRLHAHRHDERVQPHPRRPRAAPRRPGAARAACVAARERDADRLRRARSRG